MLLVALTDAIERIGTQGLSSGANASTVIKEKVTVPPLSVRPTSSSLTRFVDRGEAHVKSGFERLLLFE